MPVQHCIMSTEEEAAELEAEKARTGLNKTDILLSRATKSGAWRANRVRSGPVTASVAAAEEAAKLRWWAGDPYSSECWSAVDPVLERMGVTNIDHRAELLAEMALLRPDVVAAAYALHLAGHDPALLVRAAFEEFFEESPEKRFGAFSVDDLAKLLIAGGVADYETALTFNASNRNQLLEMCYGEAERAGESGRRAHAQRILANWRERNIEWPKIETGRDGAPRLADNTRVEFVVEPDERGRVRRQPRLVTRPRTEEPSVSVEPAPRPGQIGASAEALNRLAARFTAGAKIAGE
jgi:hypothetical protein